MYTHTHTRQFGNAIIFAFAGHDTTGHTMTWMTYELSKRPDLQRRLQAEIDELFDDLDRNHGGEIHTVHTEI